MEQSFILIPLDGSPLAAGVLPYAETLARLTCASLRLLRVVEALNDPPWGMADSVWERLARAQREAAQRYLDGLVLDLEARGCAASGIVVSGDATACIVDAGKGEDVALVAIATHGRGGVQRLLLWSVADKVVRLGTRPTLVVRTAEGRDADHPVALKRLMVPLDGSGLAEQALPLAAEVAQAVGATVVLVQAERHLWQTAAGEVPMPDLGTMDDEVTAALQRYLERVRAQLPSDLHVELAPCRGFPALMLEDMALNGGVDLVVMATHGRGGLRRLTIGSMADRMIRVGVPTLLIRPGA